MAGPRRVILTVAVLALAAAGGGLVATRFISSPADAAARTAPPPAGPITVEVVREALAATVTTRGDIGFINSTEIQLPAGSSGAPRLVSGRVPKAGATVTAGAVVLEVSGRPVIALTGAVPGYRTIGPGSVGKDVSQLQTALKELGLDPGRIDGVYDAAVAKAVRLLYRKVGYPAPEPDEASAAAAVAAKQARVQAQQALAQAKAALAEAGRPPTESARLAARGAIDAAQATVQTARNTGTPPDQQAVDAAGRQVATATGDLQQAQQALDAAGQARQQAEQTLAALKATATAAQRAAAQAAVDAATEQQASAQAVADQARADLDAAEGAAAAAGQQGPPDPAAIQAAENQLAVANAQYTELMAGQDTTAAAQAVEQAAQTVATARAEEKKAGAQLLTPVPLDEIAYLAELPRRVDEVTVEPGDGVVDPVMSVSGTELRVIGSVTEAETNLLKQGIKATLTVPGTGELPATVAQVRPTPDGEGGETDGWQVVLDPGKISDEQATALRGQNVKVDIGVGATAGEVLTVPVGSLFSDADGTPRLEVLESDGGTRFQRVRAGLTADGKVEVHPIGSGDEELAEGPTSLDVGSLVVVGR